MPRTAPRAAARGRTPSSDAVTRASTPARACVRLSALRRRARRQRAPGQPLPESEAGLSESGTVAVSVILPVAAVAAAAFGGVVMYRRRANFNSQVISHSPLNSRRRRQAPGIHWL